jgi:hypothetical protein
MTFRHQAFAAMTALACVSAAVGMSAAGGDEQGNGRTANHPAVGSYFGRAVQVCAPGAPCPQIALFMTPTLTGDGLFIGNDSLTLGGAPFGPHTTAHGEWVPTSKTGFVADYTFMLTAPTPTPSITALRFRWLANVINRDTIVGYVNIYFFPPIPVEWEPLAANQFPSFPDEGLGTITPPNGVVTDPATCTTAGCPLVFKFTVKRVAP